MTEVSWEMNEPVQLLDTLPLPVSVLTRAGRDRCFQGESDFGYYAAKDMHYYRFKLRLLSDHPHDIQSLETMLEEF